MKDQFSTGAQAIITFALCGFAGSSIAICSAGSADRTDAPRGPARFGLRALLTATLANLMSASFAGFSGVPGPLP